MLKVRCSGNVAKMSVAVVLEKDVPTTDGSDKQVGITVIIDVGKRGRNADATVHSHARVGGDVFELAAAEIFPQLAGPGLVHEVNIVESVAVDVGYGQAITVIVVDCLVGESGVVDY